MLSQAIRHSTCPAGLMGMSPEFHATFMKEMVRKVVALLEEK
jgi:hypothetical protein